MTTLEDAPTRDLDLGDAPTLAEVLPRLELFVEEARHRQFKRQIGVAVLSDKAFADQLRAENGPESLDPGWNATLTALHLVPSGFDFSTLHAQQDVQVAGYYDYPSKSLFVRSTVLDPLAQSVLVHELTHALDDQYDSSTTCHSRRRTGTSPKRSTRSSRATHGGSRTRSPTP